MLKATLGQIHHQAIFKGRVNAIVNAIAPLVPTKSRMLDVGTGDGSIAARVAARQSDVAVEGIDVMLRPSLEIPVTLFDGNIIPYPDNSFDVVSFVDVLHHTEDPLSLIKEAARVARDSVVIKDHLCENAFDHATLRAMDWVGNAPHGVVMPYNYASRATWDGWFVEAGLKTMDFSDKVSLYPAPLSWIFGRRLHFVTRLSVAA